MSNSIRANRLEERELFLLANNIPYDDRANQTANIADMKSSLISEFLYAVGSDLYESSLKRPIEELAEDMKLIGGSSEMRKPLNVGLMFFHERPDNFFPYARIEVVDKPDTSLPGPDRTITDEDIKNRRLVSRRYRNRRIGDFLKELKLVEGRNTGIPTIIRAMETNGSELPIFETDEDRTYFFTYKKVSNNP